MKPLTIGLLPMYIALYDSKWPHLRARMERFVSDVAEALEQRGLRVTQAPLCRVAPEFAAAVAAFEEGGADAIVTLHPAYSPSLEAAGALTATRLPIIVLDTTPSYAFDPSVAQEEILYNHGIHGVQDLCNVLLRNGKRFLIEAGHWAHSDVPDRVADAVKAARMARSMQTAKVGRLGEPFRGMGDFAVAEDTLRATIGMETLVGDLTAGRTVFPPVGEASIEAEMAADRAAFAAGKPLGPEAHRQSTRVSLAVRSWIAQHALTAFTVNFMEISALTAIDRMPFLEASKSMARGIGYAGEGDVLTAALTGALLAVYPDSSFTEMFCPDWAGDSIFLSHMGEMNLRLSAGKPVLQEMEFPFTSAGNPVVAYGRFRGGRAVYVNLAPSPGDTFTLILSAIEMLDVEQDRMAGAIRGWFRPALPVTRFLETYSRLGGTHHGVVVYDATVATIARFGELMGWRVAVVEHNARERGGGERS